MAETLQQMWKQQYRAAKGTEQFYTGIVSALERESDLTQNQKPYCKTLSAACLIPWETWSVSYCPFDGKMASRTISTSP